MSERENVRKKKTRSRLVFALRINLFIANSIQRENRRDRRKTWREFFFFYTNDI